MLNYLKLRSKIIILHIFHIKKKMIASWKFLTHKVEQLNKT